MNRLTRPQLLAILATFGFIAVAGCRGAQPAATETRQIADQATVTLTVSGMI